LQNQPQNPAGTAFYFVHNSLQTNNQPQISLTIGFLGAISAINQKKTKKKEEKKIRFVVVAFFLSLHSFRSDGMVTKYGEDLCL
jgi:hypothetical protein